MSSPVDWSRTCIGCGYCCTYVSLAIDEPRTAADVDHVRWYLAHRNIHIYLDHEGEWFFLVNNVCENLTPAGCAIYEERFQICRDYSAATCEMTTGRPAERVLFRTVDDFDRWLVDHPIPRPPRGGTKGSAERGRTIRGHLAGHRPG